PHPAGSAGLTVVERPRLGKAVRMGALEGKAAVVTGGSRGIGRGIVERLVAEGATVLFSYVENKSAADEVVEACEGRAIAVRADQGRLEDVTYLFDQAEERLGGLDILVNCARIC